MIPETLGLTPGQVESLLVAAGRAPSLHNSQPWWFHLEHEVIELYADSARRLPAADPHDHELRLACGAALFNLRLALHDHHIRPAVTLLPDRNRPTLLATVGRGGHKAPTPEQTRLRHAIERRRTDRRPFGGCPVEPARRHALLRAAAEEDSHLYIVEDVGQRRQLRELLRRAHNVQMDNPAFRAEFAAWTAVDPGRRDGVPAHASGPAPEPQDAWVLRDFAAGAGRPRPPGADFEPEPLLAVLTPHLNGHYGDLQAGQALQRVLLTATDAGLAVSMLSQLVEVDETREQLGRLVGLNRLPAALLRIGRGWPITRPTGRREPEDMLRPTKAATPSA